MEVSDGLTTTENDQLSGANEQINSNAIQNDCANGIKSSEKAPSDFEKEKAGNDSDNDIGNELSSKQNEGNESLAEMDIAGKPIPQGKALIGAEYRDPDGGI